MPFAPGYVVFAPDGKSLYATASPGEMRRGLRKIEFNPIRFADVPGSAEFNIYNVAVSAHGEKIFVSGVRSEQGGQICGVFELNVRDGSIRQVLQSSDCDFLSAWIYLSLSPGGERAVALHNKRLELLDFVNKTSQPIGGADFVLGAWAPDGKWIAAIDKSKQSELFLLDPNDLSRRRHLGTSGGVYWSPDSRYLFSLKQQLRCILGFGYLFSMETIEASTGKRAVVAGSQCEIQGGSFGWVDTDAVR